MIETRTINHGHICCGIGGGAAGFNRGQARVGNMQGRYVCLGGIDVDPACCADFERMAGVMATQLDLMTLGQYLAFHGERPPRGWREARPDDIRVRAFRNQHPHILFMSMPCKGFSGLLSEKVSRSAKYQALNGLTLRGLWLALEAYQDDPVELILFENVPRIATRGRWLLDQIVALLRAFNYAVSETKHDCGELGNLAQHRQRFLLVARHQEKVPAFLYEPPKRPVRGVGEVLERLPLPGLVDADGAPIGGPMHRVPRLQWKTWVRLAFVEAGSDWRSLNKLRVENGTLTDYGIAPDVDWHSGVLGVKAWDETSSTVIGSSGPSNGSYAVADPRGFASEAADFHGLRVNTWEGEAAGAITGQRSPGSSAQSVADPRVDGHIKSVQLGVGKWEQPAAVIKGDVSVGTGRYAVADPRIEGRPRFNHTYRIVRFGEASPAVAGPGGPAGGLAVADPRYPWNDAHESKMRVQDWGEGSRVIAGSDRVGSGALCVADPRTGFGPSTHHHVLKVTDWSGAGGTVTSAHHPAGGALAVADPRAASGFAGKGKYRITRFDEASGTVISGSTTGQGAFAVADPRPDALSDPERNVYLTGGHYGVVPWTGPSGAIPGHAKNNNGPWSVADPRFEHALPAATDNLVCMIRALDGTWHRPFTTLECAALQSLVDPDELFDLHGTSDSAKRERIGNCVPRDAAAAIAGVMGTVLLLVWSGERAMLSSTPVWVRDVAVALSVKPIELPEAPVRRMAS